MPILHGEVPSVHPQLSDHSVSDLITSDPVTWGAFAAGLDRVAILPPKEMEGDGRWAYLAVLADEYDDAYGEPEM